LIKKFGNIFNKIEENALVIALAVMVAVIFFQVVMRYVFNNSPSWSEEFSRYLFVWFSWIGVSAGLKDGEHLKVELLAIALKKRGLVKANETVNIIVNAVWLFTTGVVTYYGFEVVMAQMDMNVLTPAMRAPVWIAYLSIPACSGVVGIRLIIAIINSLKVIFSRTNSESEVAK
jgi:TRAP-type C4-dicarboxylate transport system permease small subunit